MKNNFLESAIRQINSYKIVGEKTFNQLTDEQLFWKYNQESSSIAIIVKHIVGNQFSRWTNFLTEDGEKEWRERDLEFENSYSTKQQMIQEWNKGWECFLAVLNQLSEHFFSLDESIKKDDWAIGVLYCAMTRATVRLELVVSEDCQWIDVFRDHA